MPQSPWLNKFLLATTIASSWLPASPAKPDKAVNPNKNSISKSSTIVPPAAEATDTEAIAGEGSLEQSHKTLHSKTISDLQSEGSLAKCETHNLAHGIYAKCQALVHKNNLTSMPPIFVLCRYDTGVTDKPKVVLWKTTEGKVVIFINEAAHRWTEAYVRDYLIPTDAEINEQLNSGSMTKMESFLTHQSPHQTKEAKQAHISGALLLKDIALFSRRMGIHPTPQTYVVNNSDDIGSVAASFTTREGHSFVMIDKAALENEKYAALRVFSGHELGHIAFKHTSPKGIILGRNITYAQHEELIADREGAGWRGAQSPEVAIEHFNDQTGLALVAMSDSPEGKRLKDNPTEQEFMHALNAFEIRIDPEHPSSHTRALAMQELKKRMQQSLLQNRER